MTDRVIHAIRVTVNISKVILLVSYVAAMLGIYPEEIRRSTLPLIALFITFLILVVFQAKVSWEYEGSLWPPGRQWVAFRWVMAFWFLSLLLILVYALTSRWFGPDAIPDALRLTVWYTGAIVSIWFLGRFLTIPRDPDHISVHDMGRYEVSTDGLFGTMAKSMPLVLADHTGTIHYTTCAMDRLIGAKRDDLYKKNLVDLMPERYRALHLAGLSRYLETRKSHILGTVVSVDLLCRNGEEKPIHLALSTAEFEGNPWFVGALWERYDIPEDHPTADTLEIQP